MDAPVSFEPMALRREPAQEICMRVNMQLHEIPGAFQYRLG
jgi:hypothetical protein